jgi:5-oxoprolinase (ATP-hydrolysing)
MRIHTVAAGGGSIVHFDGRRFRVGPDSAGAKPHMHQAKSPQP